MADITIDSLEIKIEKQGNEASQSIHELANAFRSLGSALGGDLMPKLSRVSDSINKIADAIKGIDTSKLSEAAGAFDMMSKSAAKAFDNISKPTDKIFDSIPKGNRKEFDNISKPTGKVFDSIPKDNRKAFDSISKHTEKVFDSIPKDNRREFDSIPKPTDKVFDRIPKDNRREFDSIPKHTDKAFGKTRKTAADIPFSDNEPRTNAGSYIPNWRRYRKRMAEALPKPPKERNGIVLEPSEYREKEVPPRRKKAKYQEGTENQPERKGFNARENSTNPRDRYGFPKFNFEYQDKSGFPRKPSFGEGLSAAITDFKGKAGKMLTPANLGIMMIRRVLYRVMNAIISAISTSVKNALGASYNSGYSLNKTMYDKLATSMQQIGNAIAQVIVPVLQVIQPIITMIGELLAVIGNMVSFIAAKLTMRSEMLYTDVSKIKESALAMKASIQSFDRLNVLQTSNDSLMESIKTNDFILRQATDSIKNNVNKIEDNWELAKDNIGSIPLIGETLKNVLNRIDTGALFDGLRSPLDKLNETVKAIREKIVGKITDSFSGVTNFINSFIKGGNNSSVSAPKTAIVSPAMPTNTFANLFSSFLNNLLRVMPNTASANTTGTMQLYVSLDGRQIKSAIDKVEYNNGVKVRVGGALV